MEHTTIVHVRGYHEDRFGHVNHARYLEFLEEARWDYLERHGPRGGFDAIGVLPVVVHLEISYRRPAEAGDRLLVRTRVREAGSRRIVMHQEITDEATGERAVEAEIVVVLLDGKTGRPVHLTEGIRRAWPDLASASA